jgi:hypothetical protein
MYVRRVQVAAILVVAMTGVVIGVLAKNSLMARQRIPNAGNVKTVGVGVYWNSTCTSNVTSVDWGFLEPGESANVTVYIRNEGNIRVVLSLATDDWNPVSASDDITLAWNREDHVLDSDSVIQAVLTLSVSHDISEVESFGFDILITGTEYKKKN